MCFEVIAGQMCVNTAHTRSCYGRDCATSDDHHDGNWHRWHVSWQRSSIMIRYSTPDALVEIGP